MSFMIYIPYQALVDHPMKEGDMGTACDMLGSGKMRTGFWWEKVKKSHSECLDTDGRIIL
jgi:hypothetical protein